MKRVLDSIREHSNIVILCLCWYLIASIATQVTKQILTVCPMPLFLGEFQFIYTTLIAILTCHIAYRFPKFYHLFPRGTFPLYFQESPDIKGQYKRIENITIITRPSRNIIKTVLPLGFFQFVGKFFGHSSTALVPISTVASIKTLSPVFIVIFQKIFGISSLQVTRKIFFSLFCLILGVWIIVREDRKPLISDGLPLGDPEELHDPNKFRNMILGVFFAVCSMFIFVFQNIYGKTVFTYKENSLLPLVNKNGKFKEESPMPIYSERKTASSHNTKYDKLSLMIYISIVGYCFSFWWFLRYEFSTLLYTLILGKANDRITFIPWTLLFINGIFHFLQAMITFYLLGEIATLSYSIANLMKRIAVISCSWIFVGRMVTLLQVLGLILNGLGLYLYERCTAEQKTMKAQLNEKHMVSTDY
ncbi:hypothetical protein TBLA_0D03090 [Henningerozyma blattae CBS 6284]|uniref:Sugar phosphate transporter domain-containing protein n=1 Tax=Henningerozyma blattae (strain ATCC 34711 / CBS 6284 / DSM 70876 / NBRC 10599 / NRRL Y-10934 / UCD 77-7) TaxID=1071380 RepID=I2H357_HENB6|nr:hypothetical protein TBLA_0D03090 [Tetrapisispora blattae CBS 6284]CCH60809.1 hypothetical protein TBLA_0D03090 [Tetrapisispora blattae CBS 6284]